MWEAKTPQVTERKFWKCPFKPSGGLALTSPKGRKTGGLATTCSGSHLARACVSPSPQPRLRRQRLFVDSMQRPWELWGKSEREREGWGGPSRRVPGFWLWVPQIHWQVVLQNVTEKVKCLMFSRVPLELLPTCHITLPDVHGRAQRPHCWRKKNKNKPRCSLRREEGAEGCWGLSHVGLCSVKQLPSSSLAQF